MKIGDRKEFTVAPKGRLSLRHVISKLPTIYSGKKHTGDNRPMTIRAIVDTSGSMQAPFGHRGLGAFMHALGAMHERKEIQLDVWLSGDSSCSHITNFAANNARSIVCSGGNEAIAQTLKHSNKKKPHEDFDAVLVVTDGQIGDGEVNVADFNGLKNAMAVYIPDTFPMNGPMMNRLRKQFPLAICRPDAQTMTAAVCQQVAALRSKNRKTNKPVKR